MSTRTGELTGPPPPVPRKPATQNQWQVRAADLDAHPGEWMRWPYSSERAAGRARERIEARTDRSLYSFVCSQVDGSWWLYGRRIDTPQEATN